MTTFDVSAFITMMQEVIQDAKTLEDFVNGDENAVLVTRLGRNLKTLAYLEKFLTDLANLDVGSVDKLSTPVEIKVGHSAKNFDGSEGLNYSLIEILPSATTGQVLKYTASGWVASTDLNTTYETMTTAAANAGTDNIARLISASVLKSAIATHAPAPEALPSGLKGNVIQHNGTSWQAGTYTEKVGVVTSPALQIANGTTQKLTLSANGTLTADIAEGQSMTVLIPATSYTLSLSGFTAIKTFALSSTSTNVLVLFNIAGTKYLLGVNDA